MSGIEVYNPQVPQHKEVKSNYYNGFIKDGFAHYNPELIKWASANLIPNPEEKNIQGFLFQRIYDELYRPNLRLLAKSYLFFPDEKTYKVAQDAYLDAMKEPDFDGGKYLFERYGEKDGCQFCYGYPIVLGFWLRRGIDGTNDEVWQGLTKVLRIYDKDWYNSNLISDKRIW
jgi:hypothetical protein